MSGEAVQIVQWNSRYVFFQDHSDHLMVYDTEKSLAVLRIPYAVNLAALQHAIRLPVRLGALLEGTFGPLMGKLYGKYPEMFIEISVEAAKFSYDWATLQDTLQINKFLPTAHFDVTPLAQSTFVIHGLGILALDLVELLRKQGAGCVLMVNYGETVEVADLNNSLFQVNQLGQLKSVHLQKKFGNQITVIEASEVKTQVANKPWVLHLAPKEEKNREWLFEINEMAQTLNQRVLFMTIDEQSILMGPLVIPKESGCLACLSQWHNTYGENFAPNSLSLAFRNILMGFITRIILYTQGDHFRFLLEDAQIPFNQVFVIDKSTLAGRSDIFHREVDCPHC